MKEDIKDCDKQNYEGLSSQLKWKDRKKANGEQKTCCMCRDGERMMKKRVMKRSKKKTIFAGEKVKIRTSGREKV